MDVRTPRPVRARDAVATMTVPPAKTTAAPDVPMAFAEGTVVVLARGPVLPVADHDEQRVVDPDSQADQAGDRDGGGGHVHRAGEQRDGPDAGADGDDRQADRHDGGHDGPEHDQQDEQRDQEPDPRVAGVVLGVEEHGVAAELDLQSRHLDSGHGVREHRERRLAELTLRRVEGHLGVPDPAVRRDGAGRERVAHRRDVVEGGDVGQHRVDVGPVALQRLAVLGREDDQDLALGRLGEALVEQVEGARALAVGDAELLGEGAAPGWRPGRTRSPSRGPSPRWCARGAWHLSLRCHG